MRDRSQSSSRSAISFATGGLLGRDQLIEPNHRDRHSIPLRHPRRAYASPKMMPSTIRKKSTRMGAAPRYGNSSGPRPRKVSMIVAGAPNCASALATVLVRGTDENVEVLREAGLGVVADRPTAHDEVLSVHGGQRRKQSAADQVAPTSRRVRHFGITPRYASGATR
jgi:hypothetical protein